MPHAISMAVLQTGGRPSSSTASSILHSLPTDPASIFAVLLMVVFFGFIFYVGRGSGASRDQGGDPPAAAS